MGRVLLAVEEIPAGCVAAYSDVGRVVGLAPRVVGAIMARHGHDLPWWRVVNVAGALPAPLLPDALAHWRAEGTPVRADGSGCRIRQCRVDVDALADAYQRRFLSG